MSILSLDSTNPDHCKNEALELARISILRNWRCSLKKLQGSKRADHGLAPDLICCKSYTACLNSETITSFVDLDTLYVAFPEGKAGVRMGITSVLPSP